MIRLIALLTLAFVISTSSALAASDWNGTWVGNWQNGSGVQVVMAGNVATGIFWNGDYVPDDLHSAVSADGQVLTITWGHASAVLTRSGAETASAAIHEPGKPDALFAVKIDH